MEGNQDFPTQGISQKGARELVGQMANSLHTHKVVDVIDEVGYDDKALPQRLIQKANENPDDYDWFVTNLRKTIRENDEEVNGFFEEFLKSHPATPESDLRKQELRKRVIKPEAGLSQEDKQLFKDTFPTGNYLIHGAKVSGVIGLAKDPEGLMRSVRGIRQFNSEFKGFAGYDGISFSYNGVGALPGTWRHMAMLVTSPELALNGEYKLTVPYHAARNEVQLVSKNYDREVATFMDSTLEFTGFAHMLGGGLLHDHTQLEISLEKNKGDSGIENDLNRLKAGELKEAEVVAKYKVINGKLVADPCNGEGDVKAGTVYLDYLLKHTAEGRGLKKSITEITPKEALKLLNKVKGVIKGMLDDVNRLDESIGDNYRVELPLESMIMFVPRQDLERWLDVFSRVNFAPRAFVPYSPLEGPKSPNWQLPEGEWDKAQQLVEKTLTLAKVPQPNLPYEELVGKNSTDDMAGQSIKYLKWGVVKDAKDIVLSNGNLQAVQEI